MNDQDLQRAIYNSYQSSSRSNLSSYGVRSNANGGYRSRNVQVINTEFGYRNNQVFGIQSNNSGHRNNTLAREGIAPTTISRFPHSEAKKSSYHSKSSGLDVKSSARSSHSSKSDSKSKQEEEEREKKGEDSRTIRRNSLPNVAPKSSSITSASSSPLSPSSKPTVSKRQSSSFLSSSTSHTPDINPTTKVISKNQNILTNNTHGQQKQNNINKNTHNHTSTTITTNNNNPNNPNNNNSNTDNLNSSNTTNNMNPNLPDIQHRLIECETALSTLFERNILSAILQEVVYTDMCVQFDNIAALDTVKQLLQEIVVLPIIAPELFTGIREPARGVLLFGPSGTGKTMLAKAVAGLSKAIFINISTSTLMCKYRGESEKLIRCLFSVARCCAPSIIFLDEVDGISGERRNEDHEASRRMKTELFIQMDGLESASSNQQVMVLAATNCPWDLDQAIIRRLEKRLYIPLPDLSARETLLELCLRDVSVSSEICLSTLARELAGYSGADIKNVCRTAAMYPLRRLLSSHSHGTDLQKLATGAINSDQIPPMSVEDFKEAIEQTRPSVSDDVFIKYEQWNKAYGAM